MTLRRPGCHLSLAHAAGSAAFAAAVPLFFVDGRLAAVPLALFVFCCLAAPFVPRLGFFLPVVSRGTSGKRAVAVTFDDGPDPLSTPPLLQLLQKHGIRAAFFVTGKRAARHPDLIMEILSHGHEIGNHSYSHDNLIMLKPARTLRREIQAAQDVLHGLGIIPLVFRPPVGVTNPRLWRVLRELDMINVNFSCRGMDGGNRWIRHLSHRILRRVRADDIIALHDTFPGDDIRLAYWLHEVERMLTGIREKGLAVYPLSELMGRPVMVRRQQGAPP